VFNIILTTTVLTKKSGRLMQIHAIQTGTVQIKKAQQRGRGRGLMRQLNVLTDKEWTAPLPIYAWVIEHAEGVIIVESGDTAKTMTPGHVLIIAIRLAIGGIPSPLLSIVTHNTIQHIGHMERFG